MVSTSRVLAWRPMGPVVILLGAALVATLIASPAPAQKPPAPGKPAGDLQFDEHVRPLLAKHCLECHSGDKPKGDLAIDRLSLDFSQASIREKWQEALERVVEKQMPPETKPARPMPGEAEVRTLSQWVAGRVEQAERTRRAGQGRVVLRRLNRAEYQNTIRDLLGVDIDLVGLLPVDSSAEGFDNVGEALHVSSFLMDRYLEAADKALNVAIANAPQPALVKKRMVCQDERQVKTTTEKVFLPRDDALVLFTSSAWQAIAFWQFYPPDRGRYRFRISAYGHQSGGKPVTFQVDAGPMLMATKSHLVGYFDAPAEKPAVIEFVDHLESRSTIRILPYGLANAQSVNKIGADKYEGPGLAIQWVDVEGPLYDSWPPASHQRIFGDLKQAPTPANKSRLEVVSEKPLEDAARILRDFARRAYRRGVTDADIQPLVDLVRSRLDQKYSFEQAMRVGLSAVLVSPDFLFLREKPGPLDDFALASRLSYFLGSTMPDAELLGLAEAGKLKDPEVLRRQVDRLLGDPRSEAFTRNFVGQWLGLRDIDFTEPSHILYPDYDEMLKVSMVRETELFFAEVLKHDLSLTNFVASDFSMLNGRLARHYGIPGVDGWEFQRTKLPPDSHRGGMLTMASVLKVTANGTSTSPVLRGAWVLDRILGTPPPKPPEGIAAVEPDIRGATTMREQLAKHRSVASCAACHAKIDPPGFALESFDVIGGWREHYRTTGRGEPVTIDGRKMHYLKGPKVDPADEYAGQKFADIDELKQLILKDKDQLARALAIKLLTYATGGAPGQVDQGQIDAIVAQTRAKDYGLRTLVHALVASKLFREK